VGPALNVLIVEDSRDDAELAALALRRAGHEVAWTRVEDEPGLLAALRDARWDVALVDHSLPRLSSHAVIETLRRAGADVPVIIVSGQIGEEAVVAAMQRGAVGYVPKDRLGLLAGAVDRAIQERRERLTRTRAEEERDGFFQLSLDMLAIIGEDGRFKLLNPAWERTLGYSTQQLLARPVLDLVHPEDRLRLEATMRMQALGEAAEPVECRFACADGSTRWLLCVAVRSQAHGVVYAVAHDVTERKRAEAALVSSRVARPLVKKILLSVFEMTGAQASVLLRLGQELAMEGEANDVDAFCRAYEEMGLGTLHLEEEQGRRYVFDGENLFERSPGARSTTCHLALGFLSGVVSRVNGGLPAPGAEVTCESRGDPSCRFMIQLKDARRAGRDAEAYAGALSTAR
jgi:PAS domain S-box-containing protein